MTFVLNAAASSYNCTLSSLWVGTFGTIFAGRTAWWPSTSWCPCSRRTGTMSLVQTVPSCSNDQWQEFWRKEWICRCLPHCNFWRSNDCTSRAPWESLSPSTAETVQRNVAHIGLVLDWKRKARVLRRFGSESEGVFWHQAFWTYLLRNIVDDLHTPNACRRFPICQSRARTTVSPSKLTAKLGVMSSRPPFQQACLRYIFCHFRAVTGKETRDINNMQWWVC